MLQTSVVCRLLLADCLLLASFAIVAVPAVRASGCVPAATAPAVSPTKEALRQAARSVVREINQERADRKRPRLRIDRRLERAGGRHARDMVRRGFFSHLTPDGRGITERAQAAGYLHNAATWGLGETLAWGAGTGSTPAAIVTAWMDSPAHRQILLSRPYRDVGIGVEPGTPFAPSLDSAATYAAELGFVGP